MNEQRLPPGWDEARIRQVIDHYDAKGEDEQAGQDSHRELGRCAGRHDVMVAEEAMTAWRKEKRPTGIDRMTFLHLVTYIAACKRA